MIPQQMFHLWLSNQPEPTTFQDWVGTWPYPTAHYDLNTIKPHLDTWARRILDSFTRPGENPRIKYAKANDYLRVKLVYEYGGIYCDGDVEVLKPFGDLLDTGLFLGAEDDTMVNMAVFGAVKGHWFLKEVLKGMRANIDEPNPVAFSLGLITKLLRKYGWSGNKTFRHKDLVVYDSSYFYPSHWTKAVKVATPAEKASPGPPYSIHHWAMEWNKTVSVVIPCYKYAHYLDTAIQSVLAQTYKEVEIIVVDDCSPDNTAEVVARYPTVKYIRHNRNRGLSASRNTGIRVAKGKWIQCLDADDKLAPMCIEACVRKGGDIICPGQQEFDGGQSRYSIVPPFDAEAFLRSNRIHCASLFLRKIWADVGGYDEGMSVGYEDWCFWISAVKKGYQISTVVDSVLFYYRIHAGSMVKTMNHRTAMAQLRQRHPDLALQPMERTSPPPSSVLTSRGPVKSCWQVDIGQPTPVRP